jgi:hypothetical protein
MSPLVKVHRALRHKHDLFLKLAEASEDPDRVDEFFRRYVTPGKGGKFFLPFRSGSLYVFDESEKEAMRALTSSWATQGRILRHAVALWEKVQSNDPSPLERHFSWGVEDRSGQWLLYDSHPHLPRGEPAPAPEERIEELLATEKNAPQLWAQVASRNVIVAAKLLIQRIINDQLATAAELRLLWDPREQAFSLHVVPRTLLGGMWLQFAEAVQGEVELRRCQQQHCAQWFTVSRKTARMTKLYCSDSCKVQAYQARKGEAIRLKREGMKVNVIAQQVGTTIEQVKKWIAQGKENASNEKKTKRTRRRLDS